MIPTPRTQITVRTASLVLLDIAAISAGWYFASNWRLDPYWGENFRASHQAELMIHAAVFFVAGILFETYDPRRPYATFGELRKLLGGYIVTALAELLIMFFRPEPPLGRGIFVLNVGIFVAVATAGRFVYSLFAADIFRQQAIVVTSGDVAAPLLGELKRAAAAVYQVQGYVAPARDMSAPNTAPWLGDGIGSHRADRAAEDRHRDRQQQHGLLEPVSPVADPRAQPWCGDRRPRDRVRALPEPHPL